MILPLDISTIAQRLALDLPGEAAHIEMLPYRDATSKMLQEVDDYRESAVAVLLYHDSNTLKSVLIQRPTYNGTHSGQIAFPGGKRDEDDADLLATAIREMHEEVGFYDPDILHLGELTRVFIPVSRFLVYPNVFYSHVKPDFIPDPYEVADIITFELFDICQPESLTSTKIQLDNGVVLKDIPCFQIQEHIVWGATALIMNELRRVLSA